MKVVRAGDLPRSRGMTYFGGWDWPSAPAFPPVPPLPRGSLRTMFDAGPIDLEFGPEIDDAMESVRVQLDQLRPELDKVRTAVRWVSL